MCSPRCLPPKEGAFFLDLSSEKKNKEKNKEKERREAAGASPDLGAEQFSRRRLPRGPPLAPGTARIGARSLPDDKTHRF